MLDEIYAVRFWARVRWSEVVAVADCWPWGGSNNGIGYGQAWLEGRLQLAHRVAYEILVGPIPEGLEIDHLCRNRGCVNPGHMEPVTHGENVRRKSAFCRHGHDTSSTKRCQRCEQDMMRKRAARKRQAV